MPEKTETHFFPNKSHTSCLVIWCIFGAFFWTPKTRKTPSECIQKGFLPKKRESRDSVGPGALRQLGLSVSNQERTARPKAGKCLCPGALESKLSEAPAHKRQTPHFRAAPFFLIALRGEDEIRTRGTLETYVGLANRWFQPLTHLSRGCADGFCQTLISVRTAKI